MLDQKFKSQVYIQEQKAIYNKGILQQSKNI